ncbi:MAG: GvpL/GvpF family gas vesicle protein [Bacteroidota bacterium]|jgi:Gas vesicle synthesis protein GvpL/GvpF
MINELIYVYCISVDPQELINELRSRGLKSICIDGFNVIIKNVQEKEFSEENLKQNIADLHWLEANAREHINVIGMIMGYTSVIPFKFGTIFNSRESLEKFIIAYSASLLRNFDFIRGKEEWSVKIYCNRKTLSKHIDELSEPAAALEKQIMASSPGKAFLLQRKKADLIQDEMDRICKECGQSYFNELSIQSEANSLNNLLPKEVTGREDTMILNAAFLVTKDKVTEFKGSVTKSASREVDSSFNVELTGPWPPFSFISINEKTQ